MATLIARIVASTFLQAVTVYFAIVVLSLFHRAGCEVYGVVGLTAFTILAPLLAAERPHFWRKIGAFILCWFALFVLMEPTCEALLGHKIGEEAMIFLLPFMLFPLPLLVAIAIHFLRRPTMPIPAKDNEPAPE
jgi:hypothetical protein